MLIIFDAMAIIYFYSFAAKMGAPKVVFNNKYYSGTASSNLVESKAPTFFSFLCDVFNIFDVIGVMNSPKKNEPLFGEGTF
jgi:hypothetical protein